MSDDGERALLKLDTGEVLLVEDEFGIAISGASADVSVAIEDLLGRLPVDERSRVGRVAVTDAAAVAASGVALASTSGEYLRLTADSMAKVSQFGAQLDQSGAMRGYVRGAGGQFAGQLSFEPVSLAAEQALALQSMALSLALRTAIANVQKAVERVEGKVDAIDRRMVSRTLGDVVGTFRLLARICEETNERGRLLSADWDAVAGIGHKVQTDLEALRDDAKVRAAEVSAELTIPKRVAKLEAFQRRGDLVDTLNLILVLEQSLHLWEYLRLQRVAQTDSEHVASALAGARRLLKAQTQLDRDLVDSLNAAVEKARVIEPLETFRIFSRQELDAQTRELHTAVVRFAEAGRLPVPDSLDALAVPSAAETRGELKDRAVDAGRTAKELGAAVGGKSSEILKRSSRSVGDAVRSGAERVDPRQKERRSDRD